MDGVIKQIEKDAGIEKRLICEGIPLLETFESAINQCPYAVKLGKYVAQDGNPIMKSLVSWQEAVWAGDDCTKKFVAEMETIDNRRRRERRERRRLKKYTAEDSGAADTTWGMHLSVSVMTTVLSFSSSIGFVSNNCGCEDWEDIASATTKKDADKNEKLSPEKKNRATDFYCMKESGDKKCYLPDANGYCPKDMALCKNNGLQWNWGLGTSIGVDTDLFLTFGLSALSAGISVGLGFDFHIPNKECGYFPGMSYGASSSFSLPGGLASLSPSISVTVGCKSPAECGITDLRYCGTSAGISIGTSAGIKSIMEMIEDQIGKFNGAVSFSLPLGTGGPLVGLGAGQTAAAGGCDNVAYALGWKIMTAIGDTPPYPLGDWKCKKKLFKDMKGPLPAPYLAADTFWFKKGADFKKVSASESAVASAADMVQNLLEVREIRVVAIGLFAAGSMGMISWAMRSSKEEELVYESLL